MPVFARPWRLRAPEAVALLRARSFDLVMTDLRMADVDGFDVLDAVGAGLDMLGELAGAREVVLAVERRGRRLELRFDIR